MSNTYISKMGETVDMICFKYYGKTSVVTELVLDHNPGISLNVVLPLGTVVILPDYVEDTVSINLVNLWE